MWAGAHVHPQLTLDTSLLPIRKASRYRKQLGNAAHWQSSPTSQKSTRRYPRGIAPAQAFCCLQHALIVRNSCRCTQTQILTLLLMGEHHRGLGLSIDSIHHSHPISNLFLSCDVGP